MESQRRHDVPGFDGPAERFTEPDSKGLIARRDLPFVVLLLATGGVLLYLGRSLTFWFDEWRSMTSDGSFVDYLRPVNEHWITLHLVLYRATFAVVGLHSYVPYLAELIALHMIAVTGAYVLMRRRVGAFAATVLAVPLLFLGAGGENLFWAFQTTFVGSVACGMWALAIVEASRRRSVILTSVLLVGAVMWSGVGLVFLVCVAVRAAFDAERRDRVVAVVPPTALYAAWHVTLGAEAVGSTGSLAGPIAAMQFGVRAIGHSLAAYTGLSHVSLGEVGGLVIFAALCLYTVRVARVRAHLPPLAAAAAASIVALYLLIGMARATHEHDYLDTSRYIYVVAFLCATWIVDLLPDKDDFAIAVRQRPVMAFGLLCVFAWVTAVSFTELANQQRQARYHADVTRAIIDLATENEGASWIKPNVSFNFMPSARDIPAFMQRHGSPLDDVLVPAMPPAPSPQARGQARRLFQGEPG